MPSPASPDPKRRSSRTGHKTIYTPPYELVVAKSSLLPQPESEIKVAGADDKPGTQGYSLRIESGKVVAHGLGMPELANFFTHQAAELGRRVVDKTGLTGVYSFALYLTPTRFVNGRPAEPADDAPSLFTALQAIGLKLQPSTGTVDTLIIDHVDRPSAN